MSSSKCLLQLLDTSQARHILYSPQNTTSATRLRQRHGEPLRTWYKHHEAQAMPHSAHAGHTNSNAFHLSTNITNVVAPVAKWLPPQLGLRHLDSTTSDFNPMTWLCISLELHLGGVPTSPGWLIIYRSARVLPMRPLHRREVSCLWPCQVCARNSCERRRLH